MKILLLSEAPMSVNSGGISQTLYNVFSFCNPENILCIAPINEMKSYPPTDKYKGRHIGYRFSIFSSPRNRMANLINPIIDWLNFSLNQLRSFGRVKEVISQFSADVVVVCPNGPIGVFMTHKLLGKNTSCILIPYFMDDWMVNVRQKWLGGNIHNIVQELLQQNSYWMMISYELGEILAKRYGLTPKSILEIHNPVDVSDLPNIRSFERKKVNFELAYAGSLWPMHYDAFVVVAKAMALLSKSDFNIRIKVYTSPEMWNWRKKDLEQWGVFYGGFINYNELHQYLSKADALILTSSFKKEFRNHSESSIQTKITDYLKAGSLIISCGPSYSVNHKFLKRNKCGVCVESDDPEEVAKEIKAILMHKERYDFIIDNGYELLKNEFSLERVHRKLLKFIDEALKGRLN